jgi:WbqC-like protein family
MKLAIMQPYLFPYIGYFQLINAADKFVVYDNIQFTKKGWINRNRILVNGKDEYITLPLKKDSDFLNIDERKLADTFKTERIRILRKISGSYSKAPEFNTVYALIESVFNNNEEGLFSFIYQSLLAVCNYLDIKTEFVISSTLPIDHLLRSQDKVIAICKALHATEYINPAGGVDLYSKENFRQNNIELNFIKATAFEYKQFSNEFIPWLSIIDVLMFNPKEKVQQYVQSNYTII